MSTDQTIRTTGNSQVAPLFRDRLVQPSADNNFLDLLSSLSLPVNRPSSLLASGIDSQLSERDYAEQQRQDSNRDADRTDSRSAAADSDSEPSKQDEQTENANLISCCWWNDDSPINRVNQQTTATESLEPTVSDIEAKIDASVSAENTLSGTKSSIVELNETREKDAADLAAKKIQSREQDLELVRNRRSNATDLQESADASSRESEQPNTTKADAITNLAGEREANEIASTQRDAASVDAELQQKIDHWAQRKRSEHHARVEQQDPDSNPVSESTETDTELSKTETAETRISGNELTSDVEPSLEEEGSQEESTLTNDSQNEEHPTNRRSERGSSRVYKTEPDPKNATEADAKAQVVSQRNKSEDTAKGQPQILQANFQTNKLTSDLQLELQNAVIKQTNQSALTTATENARPVQLKDDKVKFATAGLATATEVASTTQANSVQPVATVQATTNQSQPVKQTAQSTLQRLPQQAINRITSALKEAPNGDSTMRLRLNPIELGSVDIEIAFRNGVMSAKLKAERGQTQQMLKEGLESLKTRLSEHGITIESLEVEVGVGSGTSGGGTSDQQLPAGQDGHSSGFFAQQERQNRASVSKTAQDESSNKDVETVGRWAVNVVA